MDSDNVTANYVSGDNLINQNYLNTLGGDDYLMQGQEIDFGTQQSSVIGIMDYELLEL